MHSTHNTQRRREKRGPRVGSAMGDKDIPSEYRSELWGDSDRHYLLLPGISIRKTLGIPGKLLESRYPKWFLCSRHCLHAVCALAQVSLRLQLSMIRASYTQESLVSDSRALSPRSKACGCAVARDFYLAPSPQLISSRFVRNRRHRSGQPVLHQWSLSQTLRCEWRLTTFFHRPSVSPSVLL